MSGPRLVWHQFRYDQKIFWRNPAAVFFTVMLPLIFLFIFATIFGNDHIPARHDLKVSTYYVPGIMTLALSSATLVSLAISLTRSREDGVLKRLRGTPVPAWVVVAGRVGNSIVVSALMVVLVTALGHFVYGVKVPTETIPALLVALLVGAAAFSCLGFALTALIPTEEAAPAVTNAVVLPLYFLSGVFIPENEIPKGVLHVANVFPIRPLFQALLNGFDPFTRGAGFQPGHLAVVGAWGVFGLLSAVRRFSWTPRAGV
jgi:ABC-2 type transport system permease protein